MIHTIQNDFLKVQVKSIGAELCSIINLESNQEYIWQAHPDIWANHAPNLFPIVGALKNNTYLFDNKEYSLPKHGFIRYNSDISLSSKTSNSLCFSLLYSNKTLEQYPFKFEYKITYTLIGKTLAIKQDVINLDTQTLLYSLGGHPAFNCPLTPEEVYDDYYLAFEHNETLDTILLSDAGLLSNDHKRVLTQSNQLPLHNALFNNDALIFDTLSSRKIDLISKKSGKVLSMNFEDFSFLGLWAKPNAPYICIEPWLGIADHEEHNQNLNDKKGILTLPPKTSSAATYSITIS
ncbi:aldose 1-epimerase family protein [Aquimarina rhabdastrellae]